METILAHALPLVAKHGGHLAKTGLKAGVRFIYNELLSNHKQDILKHPVDEVKKVITPLVATKTVPKLDLSKVKKTHAKSAKGAKAPVTVRKTGKKPKKNSKKPKAPHGSVRVSVRGRKRQIIKFSENEKHLAAASNGTIVEGSADRAPLLSGPESSIANESNIIDKIAVKQLHPKDPFVSATVDGIRIQGVEYITRLTTANATAFGNTIYTLLLNPATWLGSRVNRFAQLYEKYFFRSVEVQYEPIVAKTEPGQIGMAIYHNAAREPPPNSEMGYRQLITQKDAIAFPVYQVQTMSHNFVTPSAPYYVAPDASYNDSIAGNMVNQAKLVIKDGSGLSTLKTYGSIIIKYDISFYDSTLMPNSTMVQFSSAGTFDFPGYNLRLLFDLAPVNTTGVTRFFVFIPAYTIQFSTDAWGYLSAGETYYAVQPAGTARFDKVYLTYSNMLADIAIAASYIQVTPLSFGVACTCLQIGLNGLGELEQKKINDFLKACPPEEEEESEEETNEEDTVSEDANSLC